MPGSGVSAQLLRTVTPHSAAGTQILLLLQGQLVVDLPLGEFRVLQPGDSLLLPAGAPATLQPIAGQAILVWVDAR